MSAKDSRKATPDELQQAQFQGKLPPLPFPQSGANHEEYHGDELLEPGDFEKTMDTSEDAAPIEFSDDDEEAPAASESGPEAEAEAEPESNDDDDTGATATNDDDAGSGSEADSEESDAGGASDDEDEDEDEGAPAAEAEMSASDEYDDDDEDEIAPAETLPWPGLNEVDFKKTKYVKMETLNPGTQEVTRLSNTPAMFCAAEAIKGDTPGSKRIAFVNANRQNICVSKAHKPKNGSKAPKSAETVSDDDDGSSAAGAAGATSNKKQVATMQQTVAELRHMLFQMRDAAHGAARVCPGEIMLQTHTCKPTSTTTISMDPPGCCGAVLSPKERRWPKNSSKIPAKYVQVTALIISPDGALPIHRTLTIAFISTGLSPFEKMQQVAQVQGDIDAWVTDIIREYIGDQMITRLPTSCTKTSAFPPDWHEAILNAIKRAQFTSETMSITSKAAMYDNRHRIVSGAADHLGAKLAAMIGSNTAARNPDAPLPSEAAMTFLAATLQKTVGMCHNALSAMTESYTPPQGAQTQDQISDILKFIEIACIDFDRNDYKQLRKHVKRLIKNLGQIATATNGAFIDAEELKAFKNTGRDTLEETWTAVQRYYDLKQKLKLAFKDDDDDERDPTEDGAAADELDPDVKQATEADRKRVAQKAQEVADQLVDGAKGGIKSLIDTRFDTVMRDINELTGDDPETQLATTKIMLQRMQDFAQKEAARKKAVAAKAKANRAKREQLALQKLEKLGAHRSTRASTRSSKKRRLEDDGPGASKLTRAQAEAEKRPFPQPATADPAKRPRRH